MCIPTKAALEPTTNERERRRDWEKESIMKGQWRGLPGPDRVLAVISLSRYRSPRLSPPPKTASPPPFYYPVFPQHVAPILPTPPFLRDISSCPLLKAAVGKIWDLWRARVQKSSERKISKIINLKRSPLPLRSLSPNVTKCCIHKPVVELWYTVNVIDRQDGDTLIG